jgi:bile acid:Na+ symporter, BASS family
VTAADLIKWISPLAVVTVFTVMFSLGLLLERDQIAAALQRRVLLAAVLFAVIVPVPALAVIAVKLFGLRGVVAAGIVLMAISPGAPVALRRAIQAGAGVGFAPTLHLAIVMLAVVTIPISVMITSWIFSVRFAVSPLDVARQVFFAQLLPLGIGAALRAWRPVMAARLESRLAAISNLMLLALAVLCVVALGPRFAAIGWAAFIAGVGLTLCALVAGAVFAGRDASVRPAAAIAAAMRNPGLALLIASRNAAPPDVTASVFEYALGLALVILTFVAWRRWRSRLPMPELAGKS